MATTNKRMNWRQEPSVRDMNMNVNKEAELKKDHHSLTLLKKKLEKVKKLRLQEAIGRKKEYKKLSKKKGKYEVHRTLRASLLATAASCRSHLSPLMRKAALTMTSLLATAANCRRSLPCWSRTLRASLLATAASCRRYLLSQARTLSAFLFLLARSCRCHGHCCHHQELVFFQAGLRLQHVQANP
jgi:hypothetical protein